MEKNYLNSSFVLPCGTTIKNRLIKSAMTERISSNKLEATEELNHLYKIWSNTGAGILITGNVMIDEHHRESAGNVYIGDSCNTQKLKEWVDIAKQNNTHVWAQISHAGRQTNKFINTRPLAPSAIQLKKMGLFGQPRAMSEEDIQSVIKKFVSGAKTCKESGFTGIQFHAAHGYLLSQFLSPNTNVRTDQWGGNIENRSRLLMAIIDQSRELVGSNFPISVKLNSSDFQRGGFSEEDSLKVIKQLEGKIDLLEISGGTYERLVFFELNESESKIKDSTRRREAYFIEFSKKLREISSVPLLITGGFRSFQFCNDVLKNKELDFIGMARPFITNIDEIPDFLNNKVKKLDNLSIRTGLKALEDAAEGGYYARQLVRLAKGKGLDPKLRPFSSSIFMITHELKKSIAYRMS